MKKLRVKQISIFLLLLIFVVINYYKNEIEKPEQGSGVSQVEAAYERQQSDVQVKGRGQVIKLLADDLKGAKHQKFIVKISDSLTVLISHNIDLAPRINNLSRGKNISFYGEYVFNNKGGLVHWTHHDPQKRHVDGWLKYNGKTYQ